LAHWGRRRSALAFYGLGVHLGRALSQNAQGHLLGHVRDQGLSSTDPNVRIYQTRERQTFHTDSADLVGLLCLQRARRGGASALVSVIYQRQYIDSAQRFPDVPRLSAQQRAALDLLDALADDPALHFMMDF